MNITENLFKHAIDSEYVEDVNFKFFNGDCREKYTGRIYSVFVAREDWQENGLILVVKFIKPNDIQQFIETHDILPGMTLKEKIFIRKYKT